MNTKQIIELERNAATAFGFKPAELRTKSRRDPVANARKAISFILFETGMQTVMIAKMTKQIHNTVSMQVSSARNSLQTGDQYGRMMHQKIESIKQATPWVRTFQSTSSPVQPAKGPGLSSSSKESDTTRTHRAQSAATLR